MPENFYVELFWKNLKQFADKALVLIGLLSEVL